MTYTTSIDKIVRNKTIGAFILFTIIPLSNLFRNDNWIFYLCIYAIFMLIMLWAFLHKPISYEVDHNKVTVRRPIGNIQINLQTVKRIDRIHHDLLKNVLRGGAFGYFGKFDTDLGKTTWYGTRRDNLVVFTKHDNSKIVLTPDQCDVFVEGLNKSQSH